MHWPILLSVPPCEHRQKLSALSISCDNILSFADTCACPSLQERRNVKTNHRDIETPRQYRSCRSWRLSESAFVAALPDFRKNTAFWELAKLLRLSLWLEQHVDGLSMEHWWNDTDRGNWSTGRKTPRSATLSSTNHSRTGLGSNLIFCGEKPETNLKIQFLPHREHRQSALQRPMS
jgi:hypothetical protein